MFLKCDPYRVWCSIFYSKFVNCILLRSLFVFVKGRGTCGSGKRNVKIWIDFRKSSRCSLTSPLSQEREKSSRSVFTMCGEPWLKNVLFCYIIVFNWQTYLQFLLAEIYIYRFSSASSETCLKSKLLGPNFCVRNEQILCLYRWNQRNFLHWNFIYSLIYPEFQFIQG